MKVKQRKLLGAICIIGMLFLGNSVFALGQVCTNPSTYKVVNTSSQNLDISGANLTSKHVGQVNTFNANSTKYFSSCNNDLANYKNTFLNVIKSKNPSFDSSLLTVTKMDEPIADDSCEACPH